MCSLQNTRRLYGVLKNYMTATIANIAILGKLPFGDSFAPGRPFMLNAKLSNVTGSTSNDVNSKEILNLIRNASGIVIKNLLFDRFFKNSFHDRQINRILSKFPKFIPSLNCFQCLLYKIPNTFQRSVSCHQHNRIKL